MSLHTNCLYWHPLTHIQSHSLAVNRLLSTKGVRMLHGHCVEYSFSRLRWMQKSPVHSEAATAARKTAENQPASQWLTELQTDVLHLPPFLLLSHQRARSLSLFLTRSTICGWSLLSAYKLTQTPSFFPLPPPLSLFLHATALCSAQDICQWRERERKKERKRKIIPEERKKEGEEERDSSLHVVF